MLGKPEWFRRRKYAGWGFFPKTFQGWIYLLVIIAGVFVIQVISGPNEEIKLIATFVWAGIFALDSIDIMIRMPRDEREKIHEAIAERNALWVMIIVLAVGIAYRAAQSALANHVYIDPVILIALFGGLLAKAVTNVYLDRKN